MQIGIICYYIRSRVHTRDLAYIREILRTYARYLRLYKEQQSSLLHQCPRWHTQACLAPMCLKNGSGNALAGRLWEFFLGRILKTLPHPKCTAHLVCSRDSSCEWVDFVSARMLAYLSRNVRPSRYQNGTHQTPSRIHSTTDVPVLLARKGVWHIHSQFLEWSCLL